MDITFKLELGKWYIAHKLHGEDLCFLFIGDTPPKGELKNGEILLLSTILQDCDSVEEIKK